MGTVLARAVRDPSFTLIFLGFFSCGYQLGLHHRAFPGLRRPRCAAPIDPAGMLASLGITTTSALGAVAISIIGLANIGGTLAAGWLGKRYTKKYLLAAIYTARTVVAAAFILMPMTPATVILFSAGDGGALAGHRAADLGPRRAYLRAALHGHALRARLLQPPARRLSRASGSAAGSTTSTATTRWSGGSASGSAPFRRSSTCRSASARPCPWPPERALPAARPAGQRPGDRHTGLDAPCGGPPMARRRDHPAPAPQAITLPPQA